LTVREAFKKALNGDSNDIDSLIEEQLGFMNNYFKFSSKATPFPENKIVCHKEVDIGNYRINYTIVNTTPLSMRGENDKGFHYVSQDDMNEMISKCNDCNCHITLLHHPFDYFNNRVSSKLLDDVFPRSSFVLFGHTHESNVRTISQRQ